MSLSSMNPFTYKNKHTPEIKQIIPNNWNTIRCSNIRKDLYTNSNSWTKYIMKPQLKKQVSKSQTQKTAQQR